MERPKMTRKRRADWTTVGIFVAIKFGIFQFSDMAERFNLFVKNKKWGRWDGKEGGLLHIYCKNKMCPISINR
jgi:hypothetical protein